MVLKPTSPAINGSGQRKLASWIDRFVEYTDNLEAPVLFRKWTAIATIAAALEQRVWLTTSDRLYPNLYTILVGHPGVGKTRTIMKGRAFLDELEGFHIAPTSMKMASLVDALLAAKRNIVRHYPVQSSEEFHSMSLLMDEWGSFMHAYDDELVAGLTTFYDVTVPYEQHRRGKEIRIKIPRPQLNILAGSTPVNLIKFMPDYAWDQGFTSRIILVFSGERNMVDDFAVISGETPPDLIHDIKVIFNLYGEFEVTKEYQDLVNAWRENDEQPKPSHPKLSHYNTRRRAHLYKLSMVAAVDSGDALVLRGSDFHRALGWLHEIEVFMPDVFAAGATSVDARAMDEIEDFVSRQGKPVTEHRVLRFASNILPAHSLIKVLYIMQVSGRLKQIDGDPITYLPGDGV